MEEIMRNSFKIGPISALLLLLMAVAAMPLAKKPVKYPLGFNHRMSQDSATAVLQSLGTSIIHKSDRIIHAHYGKEYYGVKISEIDLRFADDKLKGVTLKTEGVESDKDNAERLMRFSEAIKATYKVDEKPNGSTVDSTADIKTRFVSRYQDGGYEILVYSYFLNGRYYLTLNFEKFF
jgi:hypothetical protein